MRSPIALTPLSLLFSLTIASPLTQHHARAQPTVNCTNLSANFDSSCWTTLGISDYLLNWNKTRPTCAGNSDNTDNCCQSDEPWSTCFLRFAYGQPGQDCTQLDAQRCVWDTSFATGLGSEVAPKVHYAARSIVVVNDLFVTMYKDLNSIAGTLPGFGQALETALGTSRSPTLHLGNYDTALTAGPALLGNLTSSNPTNDTNSLAGHTLLQALNQAPAVSRAMWPASNATDASLFGPADIIQPRSAAILQRGLELIMVDDLIDFTAFTENGLFTGPSAQFFNLDLTSISIGPKTYVTSAYLQQNGWYAIPGTLAASAQTFRADCDAGSFNAAGYCSKKKQAVYWSSETKRTYTLAHEGSTGGKLASTALLNQTAEAGWASLPLLFDGAYNCTAAGLAGGNVLQFEFDGTLVFSCLSQLPIYLTCNPKAACPTNVLVDGKCPFGYDGKCA